LCGVRDKEAFECVWLLVSMTQIARLCELSVSHLMDEEILQLLGRIERKEGERSGEEREAAVDLSL